MEVLVLGIINSSFKSNGSFLQEGEYFVPDYQREYSWEEAELEDFWMDLEQLAKSDLSAHFLGQIVVHNDKDQEKKFIIDGQQRTSTSVILLDAFRTCFNELNTEDAKDDSSDITSKFIGRITDRKDEVLLTLGKKDKIFFRDTIQKTTKKDIDKKKLSLSEKRIHSASVFLKQKIDEFISAAATTDSKYELLKGLFDTFTKKFNVMYVETDDINEAFIIFETLNARGKDLETADLLKNHIFRMAGSKIEQVQENWDQMIDNLDKNDATKFIRHFWNSQYHFMREKDLYKNIRQKITSPRQAEEFVNIIEDSSNVYTALNDNSTSFFNDGYLNKKISSLNTLGAKSYFPIVLSLYTQTYYTEADIYSVLDAVETLIVRNFVVAGKVANKFELEFAKIAYSISQHELNSVDEIVKHLTKLTISDEEFLSNFETFTSKKTPVIRYIFQKIASELQPELQIINDNSKIHIEHIMPKSKVKWTNISDEDHETYLWRLGNLTLLGNEYNRSASNKAFDEKLSIYAKSDISFSKELTTYKFWDTNSISDRQAKLAKTALKVWPLK